MTDDVDQHPPETTPSGIQVSVRGFADAAEAENFAHLIARTVRRISMVMDLERLDGITVAYDYDAALAELDRGYESSRPLTRTNSEQMAGVAMAPAVMRDGVVKGHLVFGAPFVLPLAQFDNSPEFDRALYLIAHECGHVADLKRRDLAFPGTILQWRPENWDDAILLIGATAAWDEYAACRASAFFDPTVVHDHAQNVCTVLPTARSLANQRIIEYRTHSDHFRLMETAGQALAEPIRMLAYLFGSLDGINEDLDHVPAAQDCIQATGYGALADQLHAELRSLWASQGEWAPDAFRGLMEIARAQLAEGGIFLAGDYINVP